MVLMRLLVVALLGQLVLGVSISTIAHLVPALRVEQFALMMVLYQTHTIAPILMTVVLIRVV
jgi:hypothetical protein